MIPNDALTIEQVGATVPFYEFVQDGIKFYGFDTSKTPPPEPMVNAMIGLKLLKEGEKLMMINHKSPGGLFPKVEGEFDFEETTLEDGRACVIFSKKNEINQATDFSQNSCNG